ncbi:MAG: BMP family ABC transporter substrate-binding protein [Clostridia bacterium]|nr:BMP family ABC transporter substrate-binding protein [Clostridia bacterium]
MKKIFTSVLLVLVMVISVVAAGCSSKESSSQKDSKETSPAKESVKVGMVTDSGTIDDKSFNQGTWEGILKYKNEKKTIEEKYLQPSGEQHTDYVNAVNDLVDSGYKIIVTPGFKFETAINEAASNHKDTTFILIDGMTHKGDFKFVKHDNVVSVFFKENESAFLAGVAAALSTNTGKLGFIGGMEIPPVQRFGWGYQAGVKYANEKFGTKAEIVDYLYQGSFNDTAAGQTLAAGMYNKGVDIIFHAAGSVGIGVFNEAKQRAEKGQKVYVIGVDVDQFETGKISSGKSVTLTSAMKRIDVAAYDYIDAKLKGKFPGGEIITLSLAENGVGLPENNPNLSEDTIKKIAEVKKEILEKKITVPSTKEELAAFKK